MPPPGSARSPSGPAAAPVPAGASRPTCSSPRPYDGPLATTARGRTGDTPSPTPATMTSAPSSTARTCATSASSRSQSGRALRPGLGERAPVDEDDRAAERRGQRRCRRSSRPPLGSAPPIAAPGPTVSTHAPDAVTPSPSVPGCASYEPAAAAARYSSQRGTRSATTGSGSRHGPATSAARRPADTVSQPSTAHDRLRTARTVIDPTAPSAAMARTAAGRHRRRPTTTARARRRRPAAATPSASAALAPATGAPATRPSTTAASVAPAPHPCTSSCRAMTTRAAVHASGATAAGRPS